MPRTMANCSKTSSAPLILGGATSEMYIGAVEDKIPVPTPAIHRPAVKVA
jgi:hypothetical protein